MRAVIFGLGYTGHALAERLIADGVDVCAIVRTIKPGPVTQYLATTAEAETRLLSATHIVSTVPPREAGDPILRQFGHIIAAGGADWIGYYSTTGVYGDRAGAWVDENTAPAPGQARSRHRYLAEQAWRAAAQGRALDICRLAGIYGPYNSIFDDLLSGRARRLTRPGHYFGRIHRDDIVGLTLAAMRHPRTGARILHFADNEPAMPSEIVAYAAGLLGIDPPPAVDFDAAAATMSAMAQSFWAESRRVANRQTLAMLSATLVFPTYREGLRAIHAQGQYAGHQQPPG